MKKIVVLGGGPAGITAAWVLARQGKEVAVIEKAPHVGGLAATFKRGDYLLDYGPHAFHIKEEYLTELLKKICGNDFRVIPTNTYVFLKGKYFKYPLQLSDALMRLNPFLSAKMLLDYFGTSLKEKVKPTKSIDSFKDWGVKYFGKSLYNLCFGDYTERVWGMSAKLLSYKLAQQKLSKLNLGDIVKKLIGIKGKEQKAYFKSYIYPRGGVGTIFQNMASDILRSGSEIYLNSEATEIRVDSDKKRVTKVFYESETGEQSLECSAIISSIPINILTKLVTPPLDKKALESADNLRFRDLILVYLIVDKRRVTNFQWVYLLDNRFTFNRLTEQKNMSSDMLPEDKTALSLELCCNEGDSRWKTDDEKYFEMAKQELNKLSLLNGAKIDDYFVIRVKNAYPIYDLNFDQKVDAIMAELSEVTNLLSVGRNGLFLNNDIHDSMEMGLMASKHILSNHWDSNEWFKKMQEYIRHKIES